MKKSIILFIIVQFLIVLFLVFYILTQVERTQHIYNCITKKSPSGKYTAEASNEYTTNALGGILRENYTLCLVDNSKSTHLMEITVWPKRNDKIIHFTKENTPELINWSTDDKAVTFKFGNKCISINVPNLAIPESVIHQ